LTRSSYKYTKAEISAIANLAEKFFRLVAFRDFRQKAKINAFSSKK
jgi:hypothetical protein